MNPELLGEISDYLIVVALSATRVSVVFLLLPIFANETVPALVRNALYMALGLVAVFVQPVLPEADLVTAQWLNLFGKEVLIGVVIGVFFGMLLWAFEAAGIVIDTQIGTSFAMIFDPIAGNEVTLFGELLSRWAIYMFMAAGGLMLIVGGILESFVIWPLLLPVESLRLPSVTLFEGILTRFMTLTLMIAGPVLVVTFLIDISMGLINRYAQQFNVFFLSTALKSLASLALVALLLPFLLELLLDQVGAQASHIERYLKGILVAVA